RTPPPTQPLAPESLATAQLSTAPLSFRTVGASALQVAHAQSVGRVRDHNEDSLLAITCSFEGVNRIPSFGLYIVTDGMGGHNMGEKASSVAARSIAHDIVKNIYFSLLSENNDGDDRPPLQEIMVNAMVGANQSVTKAVGEGGTTGTVAMVFNDQLIIGHVGDSRAYIIASSGLEQLTRDHSLVRRLQELGQITEAEAAVHPQRNVLYRAIGQGDGLEVDTQTLQLSPGMKVLLCSDGLWGLVGDSQMLDIINSSSTLQIACDRLVEAANIAGGPDNITAILVEYNL
ncbi:MAG: serine/threonine-protein phosphatase, partial [Chloroflexi bacterium]|nr:serine/threonine-protein phosphatase [Chloroflexota bacterium]